MAEVFRAIRRDTGQVVALKRLLANVVEDEDFLESFHDEASIASRLTHENIARIWDVGAVHDSHYIALEYVAGQPLGALIDRSAARRVAIPMPVVVHIISAVAKGLAHAHAQRDASGKPLEIVHRDVSPHNILIGYSGAVKLIDFGIAKAEGKLSRTQAGTIKGKVGYMSPEQVTGGKIDGRADVFSLGICLWEALTRRRLFDGPNEIVVMTQIRSRDIQPPSSAAPEAKIPPELDRITLKALAKAANDRYATASDFDADLRAFAVSQQAQGSSADVAAFTRQLFQAEAQAAGSDNAQDHRSNRMSNKGGSDLDVFDGLAKKNSRPAPPSRGPTPPPPAPKKTLLGLPPPTLETTSTGSGTLSSDT